MSTFIRGGVLSKVLSIIAVAGLTATTAFASSYEPVSKGTVNYGDVLLSAEDIYLTLEANKDLNDKIGDVYKESYDSGYDTGYAVGYAEAKTDQPSTVLADCVYTIEHNHDGCMREAGHVAHWSWHGPQYTDDEHMENYYTCSVCGAMTSDRYYTTWDYKQWRDKKSYPTYNNHIITINGVKRCSSYLCPYAYEEMPYIRQVTEITGQNVVKGDKIIRVEITLPN